MVYLFLAVIVFLLILNIKVGVNIYELLSQIVSEIKKLNN